MNLQLRPDDLKPRHKNVSCADVRFEYFTQRVQDAIRAAGKGTFQSWMALDGYKDITPPDDAAAPAVKVILAVE